MKLIVLEDDSAVARLDASDPIPTWAASGSLSSVTRTAEELSVVCAAAAVPASVQAERGWRRLRVAGRLDFSLTGVLASIAGTLAAANVKIFAIDAPGPITCWCAESASSRRQKRSAQLVMRWSARATFASARTTTLNLPFHDAFLDVFGSAGQHAFLASSGGALGRDRHPCVALDAEWPNGRQEPVRPAAVHWAWSGSCHHWFLFRQINPAAALFGAVFVLEAVLFTWLAMTSRARLTFDWRMRGLLGGGLIIYGLTYPLVGIGFGLHYPRMPFFAVPCPTTIVTAGLLLTSAGTPRAVNVVPILWAVIGSSAAFVLGIRADLVLAVGGGVARPGYAAPCRARSESQPDGRADAC